VRRDDPLNAEWKGFTTKKIFLTKRSQNTQRRAENRNSFKPEALWSIFSISVSSAVSSAAGERKKPLSLTEPAGCAETTQNRTTIRRLAVCWTILSFSVSSVASSAAGERKRPVSHAKAPSTQRLPKAETRLKRILYGVSYLSL
jgi:hypothetical protein